MEEENVNATIAEKLTLKLKKKIFLNRFLLFILIAVILALFVVLTLVFAKVSLPSFDLTTNKIYTLSKDSKEALKDITKPVMIYAYGFEGNNNQMENFLRQYHKANELINYKMITDQSDPNIVQKNQLTSGYVVLIFESEGNSKLIDAAHDLSTYDYSTGESLDVTEQTITNTILDFQLEKKPKVYFITGHNEMAIDGEVMYLNSFLHNESFETESLSLLGKDSIPEDADAIAILSPTSDLLDKETEVILKYLENGGSIFVSVDTYPPDAVALPNFNKILAYYGAKTVNGYVLELKEGLSLKDTPWIFTPTINEEDPITKEIATDSRIITTFSAKIEKDEAYQMENHVTYTPLLHTTEEGVFIKDLNSEIEKAMETADFGQMDICARFTRRVSINPDNTDKNSNMVLLTCGRLVSNSIVLDEINPNAPIVALESNKDVVINSLADLSQKDGGLKIRKNLSSATYTPTKFQNNVVLLLIFGIPILIMIFGIVLWRQRNKRK